MKKLALLALLLVAFAAPASAGMASLSVDTTSDALVAADDLGASAGGRNYLLIQNTGATNDMFCAIGITVTSSNGFLVAADGGSLELKAVEGPNGVIKKVPGGAVNCITATSTTTAVALTY